ncbi:hypothetical protein CI102_8955 [Trichoderma harzianum]|nr:hypothetical protein CI102_8955 [Trichoderma harzianum]
MACMMRLRGGGSDTESPSSSACTWVQGIMPGSPASRCYLSHYAPPPSPIAKLDFPSAGMYVRALNTVKYSYLSRHRNSTLQGLHVCFQQGQHHVSVLLTAGPTLVCALWLLSPSPLRANYSVAATKILVPAKPLLKHVRVSHGVLAACTSTVPVRLRPLRMRLLGLVLTDEHLATWHANPRSYRLPLRLPLPCPVS